MVDLEYALPARSLRTSAMTMWCFPTDRFREGTSQVIGVKVSAFEVETMPKFRSIHAEQASYQ